ncbi:MAG: hypothetical protein OEY56_03540 [Cyclobacteriaceae bacterium]|nr:hypothetical protein [Cyclobacteriaceae bacterium]
MEWLEIIGFVILGIALVVAEIVFIPGIFIAGSIGVLSSIYAIHLGYINYGNSTGTLILIVVIMANILALVYTFRGKSWERFSLRDVNETKVNHNLLGNFDVGNTGITTSVLKPIGKAIIHDREVEVRSNGMYINENVSIEITKIESGKIFVTPIN